MPLSSLFPRGYVLENPSRNLITRFRNRERCINSVFWSLYSQLDSRKTSVLVVDKREDLENLNYLISKYGLRELSYFVDDSQHINKTYLKSKSKDAEKLRPRLGMRIADFEKAKSLFELESASLKSKINKLRVPLMGRLSIAEINDRLELSSANRVDVEEAILKPPYTYASYEEKKALYKQIESKYDTNYQFVSMHDPFNETIFLEASIDSVKTHIQEFHLKANELLEKFESINKKVLAKFNAQNLNRDGDIKNQLAEVVAIMRPHQQLTDTEVSKLIFYQTELYKHLQIQSAAPQSASDLVDGLECIQTAIEEKLTSQYSATQQDTATFLEQLSGNHSDFPELESLISSVNELTDDVTNSDLFKDNQTQKSVTFAFQKNNLQQLIQKLAYARYFMEENPVYLEWKVLSKDLTTEDHTIINYLAHQNQFWDEAFQNLYLQYYLNHTMPTLDSADGIAKLTYLRQDYLQDYPAILLKAYLEDEVSTEDMNSWSSYLEDAPSLVKRYPIFVVSSDFYEKHGSKLAAHVDNFFFLNVWPNQIQKEDWISSYTVGYDPAFIEMTKRKDQQMITDQSEVCYNVVKNINGLKLSEINRAARYLGQELHLFNSDYRIFQLKNISIVSMWSASKNARLIEGLSEAGIKEIIPNGHTHNLLPGIMSDAESTKFLLLEDKLMEVKNQTTIVAQGLLLQELSTAGIKIISLDNYRLINEGMGTLQVAIRTLQQASKVAKEPVVA